MKLTLDVENTVTHRDGKMHLDPFEPTNSLTMVGILTDQGHEQHFPFDHADVLVRMTTMSVCSGILTKLLC